MEIPIEFNGDFCAFCGNIFARQADWPRACTRCQAITEMKHIPLISVILFGEGGLRTTAMMPRRLAHGCFLPSTYLDFGETWRQSAARCLKCQSSDLRIRSLDVHTLEHDITNIFALVEGGQEHVPPGPTIADIEDLSDPRQLDVVRKWHKSSN